MRMEHTTPFIDRLNRDAAAVETCIAQSLEVRDIPARLKAAMQHGVLGGGKRLRPFLLLETVRCLGAAEALQPALHAAAALECVHSYSLVHDDLPSMDNDDLRRGRPTVHRAFDDASAILAGDALLTLAFEILSVPAMPHAAPLVQILARASGASGMVGGQILDLAAEGRFGNGQPERLEAEAIIHLQALKTGALISAAIAMGAVLSQATDAEKQHLQHYADAIGLAFQIADDVLDVEGCADAMGKATGKDTAQGKGTLVTLWGMERAREYRDACVASAHQALAVFGERADGLRAAATFIATRHY